MRPNRRTEKREVSTEYRGRGGVGGWVGGCPFKAENNRNSSILLMPSLSGVTRSAWWEGYVYEFHENLDKEGVVQQDALIIL